MLLSSRRPSVMLTPAPLQPRTESRFAEIVAARDSRNAWRADPRCAAAELTPRAAGATLASRNSQWLNSPADGPPAGQGEREMVAASTSISPIRLFPVGEAIAPATGVAKDAFGRAMTYLRISLTDRCNFRCVYCMPALGMKFQPKDEHLTDDELLRLIGLFARVGVTKVRLTGGEPTIRRGLVELVRGIKSFPGITEVSMTTNALLAGAVGRRSGRRRARPGQCLHRHPRSRSLQGDDPRRPARSRLAGDRSRRRGRAATDQAQHRRRQGPERFRSRRHGGADARPPLAGALPRDHAARRRRRRPR